jgi:phosphatidate cytidylyltransferase
VLSAAVLVALILLTIWWLPWWATLALAALAAAAAGGELAALASSAGASVPSGIAALGAALACIGFVMGEPEAPIHREHALAVVLFAVLLASTLAALAEGAPSPASLTRTGMLALAPLYVGLPLGAAAWVGIGVGPAALTWLVGVLAVSDSTQYYTGRAFGRRKLAPVISPAKTVEGALGGFAGASAAGALFAGPALGAGAATGAVLGVLLAAGGMCGDRFESLLKRSAGVKDSSAVIPGHGGVLDRIDSYLFAAPLFYLYLRLIA